MFSVEYYNQTYFISTYNIRRINFIYAEKFKKLVLQGLKKHCTSVVLSLVGVRILDNIAIETLRFICGVCGNMNVKLIVTNADEELLEQLQNTEFCDQFEIKSPAEIGQYAV